MDSNKSLKKVKLMNGKKMCFFCFLIAFLPRLIFLKWAYPLNISADEFSLFLPIAKILGWDWSSMVLKPLYYGYGFIILLTPLFKWIEDPIILYRVIVVFMILAQAAIAPAAYYITKRFFKIKDEVFACLTAVACSYLVTQRAVYVYNEFIYVLLVWLIFLILMLLQISQDNINMKRVYSVLLGLVMSYAMTIHARAVTFFMAAAVLAVLYYWLYRKHILSYVCFIVVGGSGYILSNLIKNRLVQSLFSSISEEVANTSVSFSTSAISSSPKALTGWFDIIIGQINSMVIMTGGVVIVFVVIGCIYIWRSLLRDKVLIGNEETEEQKPYVIVFVFFLAAAAITILGQSFSWLPSVAETLNTGVQTDGLRALVYTRYYGAYFGPVALAGMAYSFNYREQVQKLLKPVMFIVIALQGFWMMCIVPYLVGFREGSFPSYVYSFTKGWQDNITMNSYWPAIAAVIVIMFIFCFLYKRNRVALAYSIFACILIYGYCYQAVDYEGYRGSENYKGADSSYEVLHKMRTDGTLPYTIYVQNSSAKGGGHATGYMYQFMFKEYKIVPEVPGENVNEAVFLTGEFYEYPKLLEEGYRCAQLDDGEFIYVKGKQLQQSVESCGVTLNKYLDYSENVELNKYASDYTQNRGAKQIQSDGSEGYLFYDNRFRWGGGELKTILTLELLDTTEDLVGTFELVKDNGENIFYGQDIYASDFNQDGKLVIEIPVYCNGDEILEQRMTAYEGSRIKVTGIQVVKNSLYDIGRNEEAEVEQIKAFLQTYQEDITGGIYFIGKNTACDYSVEYLEEVLGQEVIILSLDEFKKSGLLSENAFVITEGQESLFEVADKCSVLSRVGDFTIYTNNSELTEKFFEGGKLLSNANGINIAYFQNKEGIYNQNLPFKLREGAYEITAACTVSEKTDMSDIHLNVSEFGENIKTADFKQSTGDSKSYTAKTKISNDEGFGELRIGLEYPFKGTEYFANIYIKKIDEVKKMD